MSQQTFEILYNAMVEIATAKAFFGDAKAMQAIAKKALKEIAKPQEPKL